MAYPERDFLPGRRLVLAGGLAALALPATARPSLAGLNPDLARGAMERFVPARKPKPL